MVVFSCARGGNASTLYDLQKQVTALRSRTAVESEAFKAPGGEWSRKAGAPLKISKENQNAHLILPAASYIFYALGDVRFLILLISLLMWLLPALHTRETTPLYARSFERLERRRTRWKREHGKKSHMEMAEEMTA